MTDDAGVGAEDEDRRSRRLVVVLLALAALLFVWVRAPLLAVPLERDEGEYAYIAQRLLRGDVPYRDAFDQKPPAIFWVYAAAFVAFGESTRSIHLFLHLWTALTALALYATLRRLGGSLAAAYGTLIFAVASASSVLLGNAANTEVFMLLPMVVAVWALLSAIDEPPGAAAFGRWILCGAGSALACWFKPVAVTQVPFVLAVAAIAVVRAPPGARVGRGMHACGGIAAGGALVCGVFVAWLVGVGAWDAFVDAVVRHNFQYARSNPWATGMAMLGKRFDEQWPAFGPYWLLAAIALLWPGAAPARARAFLLAWGVVSAAGVAVGLYFRPHYFFQTLPALAGLAGFALAGVSTRFLRRPETPLAAAGAVACAVFAVVGPVFTDAPLRAAESPAAISRAIYGTNPFVESAAIGDYIRRTSRPDDRVYIVGSEPQILFHAHRASATRYIFFYPLTGRYPDALTRQREVVERVTAAPPLYVVWTNIPTSLLVDSSSETFVLEHARRMIARDYRLEVVAYPMTSEGRFDFAYGVNARRVMKEAGARAAGAQWVGVYRRKSDGAAPPSRHRGAAEPVR